MLDKYTSTYRMEVLQQLELDKYIANENVPGEAMEGQ